MSNYFDEFTVGQSFKHWPGRTITDFDDTWFTLMTLNTNPIHFDANFAAQSQHGQCLVNGLLVISLVAGMTVRDLSENAIANLEYESIRHTAPTFHGDTLYAESEILELTPSSSKADRGVVYVETRGVNQKGEVVLTLRPARVGGAASGWRPERRGGRWSRRIGGAGAAVSTKKIKKISARA
jgi:acyl dehydratase